MRCIPPGDLPGNCEKGAGMTIKKRLCALVFCITLILACFPLNIMAADSSDADGKTEAGADAFIKAPVMQGCYNSSKGADVRWKKVPGAAGYYIYRFRKADGGTKQVGKVTGENTLQFYDKQVKSGCWGRVYTYSVKAFDASGSLSESSNKVTFIRLAPMKIMSCSAVSSSRIQLTWKCAASSNKAEGYQIQYARTKADLKSGKGTFQKKMISKKNTLKTFINGLSANTRYYFRIRSYREYTTKGPTIRTWSQYSSIVSAKTAPKPTKTRYRALMIGNSIYPDPKNKLDGPPNDTAAMAGTLRNYGYTATIKKNRGASQILSDIRSAFAEAEESDVSLFFYSGHGDTDTGALGGTDEKNLALEDLARALKKIPGRVVIVLDCCGSGAGVAKGRQGDRFLDSSGRAEWTGSLTHESFKPDAFIQMAVNAFANADPGYTSAAADPDVPMVGSGELRSSKFLVIAAAAEKEDALDKKINGVCGGALTRTFTAGAGCTFPGGTFSGRIPADHNGDRKLTLNEMYSYIVANITDLSDQHVKCYPTGSRSVFMVKN